MDREGAIGDGRLDPLIAIGRAFVGDIAGEDQDIGLDMLGEQMVDRHAKTQEVELLIARLGLETDMGVGDLGNQDAVIRVRHRPPSQVSLFKHSGERCNSIGLAPPLAPGHSFGRGLQDRVLARPGRGRRVIAVAHGAGGGDFVILDRHGRR